MTTEAKRDYRVKETGWMTGRRVTAGQILRMTPTQARYETNIEPVEDAAAAAETTAKASKTK